MPSAARTATPRDDAIAIYADNPVYATNRSDDTTVTFTSYTLPSMIPRSTSMSNIALRIERNDPNSRVENQMNPMAEYSPTVPRAAMIFATRLVTGSLVLGGRNRLTRATISSVAASVD